MFNSKGKANQTKKQQKFQQNNFLTWRATSSNHEYYNSKLDIFSSAYLYAQRYWHLSLSHP